MKREPRECWTCRYFVEHGGESRTGDCRLKERSEVRFDNDTCAEHDYRDVYKVPLRLFSLALAELEMEDEENDT